MCNAAIEQVPAQFRKQSPTVANPPTLLLLADALQKASTNSEDSVDLTQLLTRLLPRMEQWLAWLLASQQVGGDDNASGRAAYQWRGRNSNDGKLNPMTLASGLDDYPRSSSVGQDERHVPSCDRWIP
jgi:mannosyl-oligosaccharide glucosidase